MLRKLSQACFLNGRLFCIVIFLVNILDCTAGVTVKINLSSDDVKRLPQRLDATFQISENVTISLHLQRVLDLHLNIPVYFVTKDSNGDVNKQRQLIDTDKAVAYYQDVTKQANIKLTRQSDGPLIIQGEFIQGGQKYSISPSNIVKRDTEQHEQLYNVEVKHDEMHRSGKRDYIKLAGKSFNDGIKPEIPVLRHGTRHSRDVKPTYYIDVAAAVDKKLYQIFFNRNNSFVNRDILEYFSFIFNGIDLCYREITWESYNINVRLVKVVVFQDTSVYQVTMASDSPTTVEGEKSLDTFQKFLNTTVGFKLFVPYDHAMLFVGASMKSAESGLLGLANMAELCSDSGESVSIISELASYSTILTAAHELGHSLGGGHDGEGNTCTSADRYVLAVSDSPETPGTELHPWIFSNCSVQKFTDLITELLQTSRGRMCLTGMIPINQSIPDISGRYLGQIYPPDDQCKLRHGPGYYFSRLNSGQRLCTQLICANYDNSSDTEIDVAYHGTTCGSGKLCKQGSCVTDPAAPVVNENCMFGDYNKSCQQSVQTFNGYCYAEVSFHVCCSSCLSVFQTVQGCEYGDRRPDCPSTICNSSNTTAVQECCGTCNYGTTYTAASTTTPQTVTTTTKTTASTATSSCRDDTEFLMNEMSCTSLVWLASNYCYNQSVQSSCCDSCSMSNTGVVGCEFGDKVIGRCKKVDDCKLYRSDCCEFCRRVSGVTSLTRSSDMFIISFVILIHYMSY